MEEIKETKETKTKVKPMTQAEIEAHAKAYANEKVLIELFRDTSDKYSADMPVIINGKCYLIQRGKQIAVPRKVAEVIKRSIEQDSKTSVMITEMTDQAAERLKSM